MLTNKDPGTYVVQPIYRLPPDIDIPRFKEAWKAVIATEATLRTRIVYSEEHGFVQVVIREDVKWQSLPDIQDINETTRQLPAKNGAPLTTFTLVGENTDSMFFVWTAHHAVYDGWSWTALFRKVEAHYRSEVQSIPTTVPYSRFVKYISSLDQKQSDDFWLSQLDNVTAAQFPQLPSPDHRVEANGQLLHSVQLTRNPGLEVTVPSMIRAAWGILLATYSGSDDVIWGETNSGREASVPGIESIYHHNRTCPVTTQPHFDSARVSQGDTETVFTFAPVSVCGFATHQQTQLRDCNSVRFPELLGHRIG